MAVHIQNIATAVPETNFKQSFLRDKMKKYLGDRPATKRIIHRLYAKSGIEKRHTIVNDFHSNGHPRLFFQKNGTVNDPSTGTRNKLYIDSSKELFIEVAKKLTDENLEISKNDITHVITVSCTGFFAPEPAYEIVNQLGLNPSTQRYHLGFMGCFAVFPALRMAQSFCEANPEAVVMIVSVELCTLHFQPTEESDQLISGAVFADGAAGALVSSKPGTENSASFRLEQFQTSIVEKTEDKMAWTIGDTGFDMVLSTYVPDIIESSLANAIQPLINTYEIDYDHIRHWAVHPGGRAILDKVKESLELNPVQLKSSRKILANFGNMSSATILFVLKDLLEKPTESDQETTLAMSFGPGLTIESALLTKLS